MPTISQIRLTNVVYENGAKRYNDKTFKFDGENGVFLLENGGGKTVFLQTIIQAVLPHINMADRRIKETLVLDNSPAHIAIEWILKDNPRRYGVTAVSLYIENSEVKSYKYVYSYDNNDSDHIGNIPFVVKTGNNERPAGKGEISEYYSRMKQQHIYAETFSTIKDYHKYIEENYKIIPSEWRKIVSINGSEGGVDEFFNHCKTTQQLINNLLIPTVEDAISGNEKVDFVKTFERQREHFKQNKRLLEEIEQFRRIKKKVDNYVMEYSKLHDARESYDNSKLEAKAFSKYIIEKLDEKENEMKNLENKWQQHNKLKEEFDYKLASFEILKLDNEISVKESELNEYKKQISEIKSFLDDSRARLQNIEITQLEDEKTIHEQRIQHLESQLANIDKSHEESELGEKLQEVLSLIHGNYIDRLDSLRKNHSIILGQKNRIIESINMMENKIKRKNIEVLDSKSKLNALVLYDIEMQEKLKKLLEDIYEFFNESNADEYVKSKKKRLFEIEEELRNSRIRKEEISEEKVELDKEMDTCKEMILEKTTAKTKLEAMISEMNDRENDLIRDIEKHLHSLNIYDNIYIKENSIMESLEDKLAKSMKEYESALLIERINSSLSDMYSDVPYYVADTLLAKKLLAIRNTVSYLEHGVKYLQSNFKELGESIEVLAKQYPYWANTVVTSERDKEKVMKLIMEVSSELIYPVVVLTTSEIQMTVKKGIETVEVSNTIFPNTWSENLDSRHFQIWKENIQKSAEDSKENRQEKDKKVQQIRNLYENAKKYFTRYPYELYNKSKEEVDSLKESLKKCQTRIMEVTKEVNKLLSEDNRIVRRIIELVEEKEIVTKRFELASDFITINKRRINNLGEIQEERLKVEKIEREHKRLWQDLDIKKETLESVKEKLIGNNYAISSIETEKLFLRAKEYEANYSNDAQSILEERLRTYEDKLRGVESRFNEIQYKVDFEKISLLETTKKLSKKLKVAKFHYVETRLNFDSEYEALANKEKELTLEYDLLTKTIENLNIILSKIQGRRSEKFDPIESKFGCIYPFVSDIITIKKLLETEETQLEEDSVVLREKIRINSNMLELYKKTSHELEVLTAEHMFASMNLKEYDKNMFMNFEYEKGKMLSRIKDKLIVNSNKLNEMHNYMELKLKTYLEFCRNTIKVPRIKEMAIKGIEKKKSYFELLEYQKNMDEILSKNIRIAEDDRRESDEELQTFLSHLMTYAKSVINEIENIQNKTKIKVDGVTRQIFIFTIPIWDELEAKEELRKYINNLVEDYDREKENREEDKESIRQYIEDKLGVKKLIMRILGDKGIKIKCRKVTNDLKIGQAPMTWESSNKWSGGEKWSKNMTLFLSILNYLAEKKQYLSDKNSKHRTVILDNPFGKASSKHVLDPVFFIAEKLGFQIITVTAHAEGQYVTDYFPVVYSGKLRKSSDPDKKIMEIEQTLNTVYLKSRSPESLMRLIEEEQISLFDSI